MTEKTNPTPDPVPGEHAKRWLPSSVLALAAVCAHLPALRASFVLDDRALIIENPYVRSPSGLPTLLRHELFLASAEPRVVPYYRPLTGLLNWLSFRAVGASPVGQHVLNLGLHALATVLFFRALVANGIRSSVAFPTALVLAVHPATSEVVAYLGGRQDLAGWVLLLLAAVMCSRPCAPAAVAVGAGASFIGALFHEFFAFSFVPLACLAMNQSWSTARRKLGLTLVAGAGAILALVWLRSSLALAPMSAPTHNFAVMIRACVGVLLRLVKDVLLPNDLAVDVTVSPPALGWSVLVIGLAGVALTAFAQAVRRTRRDLFGVALAGVSLIVLSASLHAGVLVAFGHISDRYAYGMLVGVLIGVSTGVACWLPRIPEPSPLLRLAQRWSLPALALALMPLTWSRDASWQDETSLQLAMIADRPLDPESRLAAGMLHFSRNDVEQAYPHCVAYARARPESEKAHLCVGTWLVLHGRAKDAIPYLRRYALARPGIESARRAYLVALLAVRDFAEARSVLDDWDVLLPNAPDLAAARAELQRLENSPAVKPSL